MTTVAYVGTMDLFINAIIMGIQRQPNNVLISRIRSLCVVARATILLWHFIKWAKDSVFIAD